MDIQIEEISMDDLRKKTTYNDNADKVHIGLTPNDEFFVSPGLTYNDDSTVVKMVTDYNKDKTETVYYIIREGSEHFMSYWGPYTLIRIDPGKDTIKYKFIRGLTHIPGVHQWYQLKSERPNENIAQLIENFQKEIHNDTRKVVFLKVNKPMRGGSYTNYKYKYKKYKRKYLNLINHKRTSF